MKPSKEKILEECIKHQKELRRLRNRIIAETASIASSVNKPNLEKVFEITEKVGQDLIDLESECLNLLKKEFGEEEVTKRLSYNMEIMALDSKANKK